ncbi:unnamed protein product, partial [Mesorhabditis belari]|uniref:Uncharacterized protein n=1 Tax=Mesorhabditis belari TaxID=2138241 RepID=A0AAF3EUC0_9BILA
MSANINSVVTVFTNLFSNQGTTLLNTILIVTTIGGQSIIRKLTFTCPCAYPLNEIHSLIFMVGPSIALLIIGIMLNSTTWRLSHGCVFRHPKTRHSWKTTCYSWTEVIAQASVAPIAWLFVVFLDGGYFTCYRAAHFCMMEDAIQCKNATILAFYKTSANYDMMSDGGKYCPDCICHMGASDSAYIEAQSQIIAWGILIVYGLLAFASMCSIRMFDKYTMVQRQYVEMYKNEEKKNFDSVAKEYATKLSEANARAFFGHELWDKKDWDWVSGVPEINNPMLVRLKLIASEKAMRRYFTPLQIWNEQKGYTIPAPDINPQPMLSEMEEGNGIKNE